MLDSQVLTVWHGCGGDSNDTNVPTHHVLDGKVEKEFEVLDEQVCKPFRDNACENISHATQ